MKLDFSTTFRPKSGALAFFVSIMVWGVGVGCFMAAMNNYLSEIYHMNSLDRGWLEFFREMPGLALVFILALLHRVSDWKVMRIGTMISMAGAAFLLIPADKIFVTGFIMIYSLGEHLVMPVRSAIAMQVAKEGHAGQSLGYLTGVMNFGSVAGSAIVAAVFLVGSHWLGHHSRVLFNLIWIFIFILMAVSVACTFSPNAPNQPSKRPRLYFNRKFNKFYALELFYGARKQIFMTFAPYVLIREYGF
ncbi:MAG: MFS transporter, partial [Lentisphaerae bacterium]|nr:MFS transporter [Lentisphaerota bacterium]